MVQAGDVPDIYGTTITTNHIFSIKGETAALKVIVKDLKFNDNYSRITVSNCCNCSPPRNQMGPI